MQRLGADDVEIHVTEHSGRLGVRWTGPAFVEVKALFREEFARHGDAVWLPDDARWSLAEHHRRRLEQWLDAHVEPRAVHWERAQSHTYSSVTSTDVAAAYGRLCLTTSAPAGLVDTVYRWWARQLHPDAGGEHAAMVAVNAAMGIIRQQAEAVRP